MHEHNKRSHEARWPWLDRIAVAWAIEIAVILWIALGAFGQCSRLDPTQVECRTTSGDIDFRVPTWR